MDDDNYREKISIDDLYTRKNEIEENKLKVFRKITYFYVNLYANIK